MDYIVLALTAFLGALFGAWATYYYTCKFDKLRKNEESIFNIYHMLCDLYNMHFWITSAEAQGRVPENTIVQNYYSYCWKIADELRKIDRIPVAEEILEAMFSLKFEQERHRAEMLQNICNKLGEQVNPNYCKIINRISMESLELMIKDMDEYFRRRRKIQFP